MSVVEGIGEARVNLNAVELDEGSEIVAYSNIQPAYWAEHLIVGAVDDAAVRGNWKAGPMLQIFARGKVNAGPAGRANAVRTDSDDDGRAVFGFRNRDERYQRVNLADLGVIFESDVESRVEAIDERRAHRGPVDLTGQ